MKKLLFLIAMALSLAVSFDSSAQRTTLRSSTGNDTVSGSATTNFTTRVGGTATGSAVIQLNVKKVSGTVGGYAILQSSIDDLTTPTNFGIISSDTLTLTNGDNVKLWTVTNKYLYYRVKLVTSGTQVLTAKGFAYIKE